MKFTTLDIENFMSVESASTRLDNRGLVLIKGENLDSDAFDSNGSGKSTIFSEAVAYALFGETIRGLKADGVINTTVKKNTCVSLGILDDNGDEYLIARHRKHKEHKNNVLLYRNGENITCKSDADTTKAIGDLIQMDYLSFTNSILFGQGIVKTFASATDADQKKILERMLQIDIFRSCQELAKKYSADSQKSIDQKEQDLNTQKNQKKSIEQEISKFQSLEEEHEDKIYKKIESLSDEIGGYKTELNSLQDVTELQEDKKTLASLVLKIDTQIKEFDIHESNKMEFTSDIKSLDKEYKTLSSKNNTDIKRLEDIRNGKNIPKTCEACGQPLPLKDTSHIENHLEQSIQKNREQLDELLLKINDTQKLLQKVTKHLEGKKTLLSQKEALQSEISDIKADIERVEGQRKNLSNLISLITKQIEEQEAQKGVTYTQIIEDKIKELSELQESIDSSQVSLDELKSQKELYDFWVNGYGNQGIKSVLLDSVTPFLNQRANYYLSKLADSSIEVIFNTQVDLKAGGKKDKFSVDVTNTNGSDDYKGNSGGEKKRVDVAVNMALQDLVQSRSNKRIDLIVYDEVFESLDEIGSESVIQLLQEKSKSCGTILVITHNESLKQLFNKSIVVSKSEGKTNISCEE